MCNKIHIVMLLFLVSVQMKRLFWLFWSNICLHFLFCQKVQSGWAGCIVTPRRSLTFTRSCHVVFEWPLVWYAYARSLNSHGVATRIRAARARAGESYAAQWGPFLYEVALYFFKAWVAKTSMRKNFKSCVQWVCVQRYKYLQFW